MQHRARYYQMNEVDIRSVLHREWILPQHLLKPGARAVDELVLMQGKHRVDVAVLNDEFHAFEIKSANDNLDRLPKQQVCYNKVFDRVTLVVDERHVEKAVAIVPPQWGLIAVSKLGDRAVINEIWPARRNYKQDPYSLTQLLWRAEAIQILAERNLARGYRSKRRRAIWKAIAEKIPLEDLRNAVREALKARTDWRLDEED
jgi:hypothetical protein